MFVLFLYKRRREYETALGLGGRKLFIRSGPNMPAPGGSFPAGVGDSTSPIPGTSPAAAPASTPDSCQGETGGATQITGYYAYAAANSASTGSRDFWTNTSGTVFEAPTTADGVGAYDGEVTEVGAPATLPTGGQPIQ